MKNLFQNVKFRWYPFEQNQRLAKFKKSYVIAVKNYAKGVLRIFLESTLESYGKSYNNSGYMYFNCFTVDFITAEIIHFKNTKQWRGPDEPHSFYFDDDIEVKEQWQDLIKEKKRKLRKKLRKRGS